MYLDSSILISLFLLAKSGFPVRVEKFRGNHISLPIWFNKSNFLPLVHSDISRLVLLRNLQCAEVSLELILHCNFYQCLLSETKPSSKLCPQLPQMCQRETVKGVMAGL